jgi:hypothetical protein
METPNLSNKLNSRFSSKFNTVNLSQQDPLKPPTPASSPTNAAAEISQRPLHCPSGLRLIYPDFFLLPPFLPCPLILPKNSLFEPLSGRTSSEFDFAEESSIFPTQFDSWFLHLLYLIISSICHLGSRLWRGIQFLGLFFDYFLSLVWIL